MVEKGMQNDVPHLHGHTLALGSAMSIALIFIRYSFHVPNCSDDAAIPMPRFPTASVLPCPTTRFQLPFPINIIITADSLEKYNAVFAFLVQIHYTKHR